MSEKLPRRSLVGRIASFARRLVLARQAARNANADAARELRLHRGWRATLTVAILAGFTTVAIFAGSHANATYGVSLLLAGACLLSGGLVGFLFGIPKSLQGRGQRDPGPPKTPSAPDASPGAEEEQSRPTYGANTNLEEVSDWLTKIIVGVGLTQLVNMPAKVVGFGQFFSGQLGGGDLGARFAIAILMYFSVSGFLFGYLWTRLFLGSALVEADALSRVERKLDAQQVQAQADAAALTLANQQLQASGTAQAIPVERLRDAIGKASVPVKIQIFYQAEQIRRDNWEEPSKKPLMERTIPVFQALVDDDADKRFHRSWAQLGYALKDQRNPDWQRAEQVLTTAIQIRGRADVHGYALYEFNRAVCRINLDENFKRQQATSGSKRADIIADLQTAQEEGLADVIGRTQEVQDWLHLNKVTLGG